MKIETMPDQTPEEKLAMERARLAISERYISRNDNPDLDPMRQDQLDKNRIPGAFGEVQLSLYDEEREAQPTKLSADSAGLLQKAIRAQPWKTLGAAALTGFILGALWKA